MRSLKILSLLFALSLLAAPAALAGHGSTSPNGSHEDSDTGEVTCGEGGTDVAPLGIIYVNEGGVEFCSGDDQGAVDGVDQAADGRIIVSTGSGEGEDAYVAADGDPSNAEETDGWIRVDGDGFKACSTSGDPEPEDNTGDSTDESCEADLTTAP